MDLVWQTGCAPQRAEFTANLASQSSGTASRSSRKKILPPPEGLEIRIGAREKAALSQLVRDLDASQTPLAAGMYRVYRFNNPFTGKPEHLRQDILEVTGSMAKGVVKDADTGDTRPAREFQATEQDALEKGIRALASGETAKIYSALGGYLAAYFEEQGGVPEKPHVQVIVPIAHYEDPATFRLVLYARVLERPKAPPIALEVRLAPSEPLPFRVVYKAWGKVKPTQLLFAIEDSEPKPAPVTHTDLPPL